MKKFLDIAEAKGDTAVFSFGRFNPPTVGHEKLMDKTAAIAKKNSAPYYLFSSHSENPKKDPLPYAKKLAYMKKMFPKHSRYVIASRDRNVFDIAVTLYNKGHKSIIMVVGSDRVTEFDRLLTKYNGVEGRHGYYGFDHIEVLSAGERDPDAEGVTGMSASKMRVAASADDYDSFKLGLPKNFNNGMSLFKDVRKFMGIRESFLKHKVNMTEEDVIRDLYMENKIFCIGDIVEDNYSGVSGKIVRRGTNYLVFAEEDGTTHKRWLFEVIQVYGEGIADVVKSAKLLAKYYKTRKDEDAFKAIKFGWSYIQNPKVREMIVSLIKYISSKYGHTDWNNTIKYIKKKTGVDISDYHQDWKSVKGGYTFTKFVPESKNFKQMYGERAKKAVAGGKVQKLVTAFGYSFKGKNYKEIDMELVGIDNSSQIVTFNIIWPSEIFGNEMKIPFKVLRRGRFMATDTSKINKEEVSEKGIKTAYTKIVKDYSDMVKSGKGKHSNSFYLSRAAMNYGVDTIKPIRDYINSLVKSNELPKELSAEYEKFDEKLDEKVESLIVKSEKTGITYSILKEVYDRGVNDWNVGHRLGTTSHQWGTARVNSFITGGKLRTNSDLDLWEKHKYKKGDWREVGTDARRETFQKMTPKQKIISFKAHSVKEKGSN